MGLPQGYVSRISAKLAEDHEADGSPPPRGGPVLPELDTQFNDSLTASGVPSVLTKLAKWGDYEAMGATCIPACLDLVQCS